MNLLARLRALWNYDPVAMQKAMLREVWYGWQLRKTLRSVWKQDMKDSERRVGLFKRGIITHAELKAAAERGEL